MIDYINRRSKGVDNGFGIYQTYTFQYEENPIIFVDDYGNAYYQCYDGKRLIRGDDVLVYGAIMPNVKARHYYHKDMKEQRKIDVKLFNEFERNCNTCKNLIRVKHPKDSQGFLFGKCSSVNCTIYHPLLYSSTKDNLMFHPDDHMNMLCYEPRK